MISKIDFKEVAEFNIQSENRAAAAVQITAEQLLREAQERQETAFRAPKQRVEDFEELNEYRGRKRKEFEERIRRTRGDLKEWTSCASWEASQGGYERSCSVYERAFDVHARNLFDRAVALLLLVDQLWYKYVYVEELLGNVPGARQVFERWMQWEPEDKVWQAYIKNGGAMSRAGPCRPQLRAPGYRVSWTLRAWARWVTFEEERVKLDKAREVFQTVLGCARPAECPACGFSVCLRVRAGGGRAGLGVCVVIDGYRDRWLWGRMDTRTTKDSLTKRKNEPARAG
ncbi:hypothetical protein DFH11DRAFT_1728623 [Phellopilus nigrolimitatus]|nr:hypothetical protein DFH11DRAFT_1728623 [Phellopilus nigrolimitatus]